MTVKVQSIPDYSDKYLELKKIKNDDEKLQAFLILNKNQIIDLQAEIYKLWTYILKADKKNITVIDLRNEKSKKEYEKYLSD
jgi:hypothetical protein